MFVSKEEAKARLTDSANLFRFESEATLPIEAPAPAPEEQTVDEILDVLEEQTPKTAQETLGLDQLDKLIRPIVGKARYRGKMDAQIAIAETSLILGPVAAGRAFGLHPSQVSAYAAGADTTTGQAGQFNLKNPRPERLARINVMKERLAIKAGRRVNSCLELLTDEKLQAVTEASTLAHIAKDMATVLDKVTDKKATDEGGIHFHLYRPESAPESKYETIEVGSRL